jgi:hypothetical protein
VAPLLELLKIAFFFKTNELVMIAPPPEVVINSVKERTISNVPHFPLPLLPSALSENGYRGGQQ